MTKNTSINNYQVATNLFELVNNDILPSTGINQSEFWLAVSSILDDFIPLNKALLDKREYFQEQINNWHNNQGSKSFEVTEYKIFLTDIGYIVPEVDDFTITTEHVDSEVSTIAGPQLVVPIMNARFALNAANARWGSLYDALYGTDLISIHDNIDISGNYSPKRGARVIAFCRGFLDQSLPLINGKHHNAIRYFIAQKELVIELNDGSLTGLKKPQSLIGFNGRKNFPTSILCQHNGLHIDIQFDANHIIGKDDTANIKDIVLESAITTIQDCEDSIAAVDAADKVVVYRNWLGLMQGTLTETLSKNGKIITRKLNDDRHYRTLDNGKLSLSGRSLLFIRNVGHLMTTNCILTKQGEQVPEGIIDSIITSLISLHDIKGKSKYKNSKSNSIYIVKPKMHGPEEVKFTDDLFARIELEFKLPSNTIKMGIMDEERRTSVNLKACIAAAKSRVVFINTGFLDRTGDEIHTSMLAGAMVPKDEMKHQPWIKAYEDRNVRIGLQVGFHTKAQIGKGMWAIPDQMENMYKEKISHPLSGANCAWVPSPTAAVLHAMHYHQVDVLARQKELLSVNVDEAKELIDLLTLPLLKDKTSLTVERIQKELDNNVQGLLGYVVRWIEQGVGCSKVPDIDNIGRMEDRATLRISSQHICNWLEHNIINEQQVMDTLLRMTKVVDLQNKDDDNYGAMSANIGTSLAFNTALGLIFQGKNQPSGYTEPLLHKNRKQVKTCS